MLQFRVTVTAVTSDTAQVVWFVLCPLKILPVSADDDVGGQQDRRLVDNAVPMPTWCAVNRNVRIVKFNQSQSTEFDQRLVMSQLSNRRSKSNSF